MKLRLLTSRRFLVLAALTALGPTMASAEPGTDGKPSHCELLDRLTPEQRQAHRDYPALGIRNAEELALLNIWKTIPPQLRRQIDRSFFDANPDLEEKEWQIGRSLKPWPSQGDPTFLEKLRPYGEWLRERYLEMHRQCPPAVG